ncbi:hypothetical protein AURDEDRAFT_117374 [Auricularia subglabra TFB-10046 SS5]|uniref:Uncharacterized protein n=1 Tax=Auricularia subglabra (strain TFB-10046 / SS5) TaxID=717982 RepID=J0WRV5_AURST|nr:hypothetical protein AURDEDRAFT_117374 [Auricularia subglabra TFB-10046 SS5]
MGLCRPTHQLSHQLTAPPHPVRFASAAAHSNRIGDALLLRAGTESVQPLVGEVLDLHHRLSHRAANGAIPPHPPNRFGRSGARSNHLSNPHRTPYGAEPALAA